MFHFVLFFFFSVEQLFFPNNNSISIPVCKPPSVLKTVVLCNYMKIVYVSYFWDFRILDSNGQVSHPSCPVALSKASDE